MSRPLVLQYIRQKRRKIVRLIIDEIGMRIHIARLRPIIHPYCCHSDGFGRRSEEHTSELQSLMRISYAVFCLKKKTNTTKNRSTTTYKQRRHDQEYTIN